MGTNGPGPPRPPKHVQTCSLLTPSTQTSVAKLAVGIRLVCLIVSFSSSKNVVRYNKVIIVETVYNDSLGLNGNCDASETL